MNNSQSRFRNLMLPLFVMAAAISVNPCSAQEEENSPLTPAAPVAISEDPTQQPPSAEVTPDAGEVSADSKSEQPGPTTDPEKPTAEKARELADDARGKMEEVASTIDQDPRAKDAAAGVLQPIYLLAEYLSFSAFYWVAFTLMVAGVVSFAFQLVLAKLVVLFKGSLNIREILSDGIGLMISLLGLILTTQAATQNSTFTQSPASVLSATVVGTLVGLVMYRWGQTLEVRAVAGQRLEKSRGKK